MVRTLALLLIPTVAFAVPTTVHHQGRLLDANGEPLQGSRALTFGLYSVDQGGAPVWSQTTTVPMSDGYFEVLLSGVDSDLLTSDRWLSVTVGSTELLPRQPVTSVPFAVRAGGVTLSDDTNTCNAGSTALHGTLRYHNDAFEGCTPDGWQPLGTSAFAAQGGTITEVNGYRIHTFTSDGTFEVISDAGTVEVLVVGGGGGGGGRSGGGGGAGGLLYSSAFGVGAYQSLTVNVGNGGSGGATNGTVGINGQNSSFGALVALGGGGGGSDSTSQNGSDGGSGGGSQYDGTPGQGTDGQGSDGAIGTFGSAYNQYNSGGGGGASGAGTVGTTTNIGDGGPGFSVNISGSLATYAGGGGGGVHVPCPSDTGDGGAGGGGNGGACGGSASGQAGVNGTGGGGGGGASPGGSGGNGGRGGNGIVIVRYPIP